MTGPRLLRQRLALALDVDDTVLAIALGDPAAALVRGGQGRAGAVQCGRAAGHRGSCMEAGFRVFVDMKLADIPDTTRRRQECSGR